MYLLNTVPSDLKHQESIIQAALALDNLQTCVNSLFDRIDSRIQRNEQNLLLLLQRVEKSKNKIKGLVGCKKAIQVYAPARFPSSHVFQDIPQTFSSVPAMFNNPDYEINIETHIPAAVKEKQLFLHVRSVDDRIKTSTEGMGSIPESLRSISSLLLHDSQEPVYDFDNEKETWKRARIYKNQRNAKTRGLSNQRENMQAAPHSLMFTQALKQQSTSGGLRYTPKLHEAPQIDLPLDLIDLPGIVENIQFKADEQDELQRYIVPFAEHLPDLPELELEVSLPVVKEPKDVNLPVIKDATKHDQITPSKAVAPPPPPPPPPSSFSPPTEKKQKNSKPNAPAPVKDTRSELMDAIRKAGGAEGGRLRPAAAPIGSTETVPARTKAGGGDLMADLHNKLLMRRKGISGQKSADAATTISLTGNPVISGLSSLIPPPKTDGSSDEETEDNDDTDWAD